MACRIRTVFPDWFLNELADEQEKKDLLAGKIKGSEYLHFKCSFCGLVYTQRICNHISSDDKPKQGCPECAKQKRALTGMNEHRRPDRLPVFSVCRVPGLQHGRKPEVKNTSAQKQKDML